jgi:hypothetical protein
MATYDPNKSYSWGPDTKFVLSGQDFSLMLHAFRGILSTKEATNTILAYEMNKKIEEIMATAVAEGKVVESMPEGSQDSERPVVPLGKAVAKKSLTKSDA